MRTSTKYEYWKWVLLNKQIKLAEPNKILIHDTINNKILIYDMQKKKKTSTNFNFTLESMLNSCVPYFVSIEQLPDFYNSLPKRHKLKFWDYVGR